MNAMTAESRLQMEAQDFEDKVCIVTGGSAGIGIAVAKRLAVAGGRVVILDVVDASTAEPAIRTIGETPHEIGFMRVDVSDPVATASAVAQIADRYGSLDVAVNNAGVKGTQTPLHTISVDDFNRVLSINLGGVFHCMKAELTVMHEQGSGAIVNTSSTLGLVGNPGASIYSASKHGILGLTKCAALEYGKNGIRVNAVAPGLTETPMATQLTSDPEKRAQIMARQTMGRVGRADEIAAAITFLASDAASFVNGTCLAADGGLTAI